MSDPARYVHARIACEPRQWASVAADLAMAETRERLTADGFELYGVWRSQIGRPRDELTVILRRLAPGDAAPVWPSAHVANVAVRSMAATLRPETGEPPRRQGNYAFRWFELPSEHEPEFMELCAGAWPGFEQAYDSQVIGLWRLEGSRPGRVEALLLTRRPDLAMWERSKLPADAAEGEVRKKLSRRYDLCDATEVATTTLITAEDRADTARWT